MTKNLVLVYIHGATATSASFSYIRERLQYNNKILLDYDCKNGFKNNLANQKPKNKVSCPHCGAVGGEGIMKRWHFDNCKLKKENT